MSTAELFLVVSEEHVEVFKGQLLLVLETGSGKHGLDQLVHLIRGDLSINHLHHGLQHLLELDPVQMPTVVDIVHVEHELDLVLRRALGKYDDHIQEFPEGDKSISILIDKLEHLVHKERIGLE